MFFAGWPWFCSAYIDSAVLARPHWLLVLKGTFVPSISFNRDFLAMLVAVIGTTLIRVSVLVAVQRAGAAYDLCQSFGWRHSLHTRPRQAPRFYSAIVIFSLAAMGMNFFGVNPMKALVGRYRPGILDSAAYAADPADDQQPPIDGRARKWPRHQNSGLDHDPRYLRRDSGPGHLLDAEVTLVSPATEARESALSRSGSCRRVPRRSIYH